MYKINGKVAEYPFTIVLDEATGLYVLDIVDGESTITVHLDTEIHAINKAIAYAFAEGAIAPEAKLEIEIPDSDVTVTIYTCGGDSKAGYTVLKDSTATFGCEIYDSLYEAMEQLKWVISIGGQFPDLDEKILAANS